jgi:hypothetical protein
MKYILFLTMILAISSCSPKVASSSDSKATESVEPKALNPSGTTKSDPKISINDQKTFVVSGTVMYTKGYCGGAAPSPELQAEYKLPKPRFGQEVLVRTGETNNLGARILARTTTKEDGSFTFDLPPGDYCIIIAQKESIDLIPTDGEYITVDKDCYKKWMEGCDASFRLRDRDVTGIKITLHEACFTSSYSKCVSWNGPLPPSAPRGDHN